MPPREQILANEHRSQVTTDLLIDFFSLYVLFSHFRPGDVLMGICLLFVSLVMRTFARAGTTFERNYSLE